MITIYKSQRLLFYSKGGKTLFSCPVSLGANPVGRKTREGDKRTPEGVYYVCSVNRDSKFYLSYGLSYPGIRDALDARREKRISILDLLSISIPRLLRLRPKWTTPLGGFIMIHGESPENKSGDWTEGCIALSNRHMDLLKEHVKRGEKVVIKQ